MAGWYHQLPSRLYYSQIPPISATDQVSRFYFVILQFEISCYRDACLNVSYNVIHSEMAFGFEGCYK